MRKAFLVLAGVAALAVAPAAQAKEMSLLSVCGASGCAALHPAVTLGADGGFLPAAAPPLGAYYVLRVGYGDGTKIMGRGEVFFVPSGEAITGKDAPGPSNGWTRLPAAAADRVKAAAEKLEPFATPAPNRAYIGTTRSVDPAPYAVLLGPLERTGVPRTNESPISIGLYWARSNPWSNDGALLNYLEKAHVVIRGDGFYRVPRTLAQRLDREAAGLPPSARGGGFPWAPVGGGIGGAFVVAAIAAALLRRRGRPEPRPVTT